MRRSCVLLIVTLASVATWAVADAQAQNAIKLFDANPIAASPPCAGPSGCDPVRDRIVFEDTQLVLSCKANPIGILSSTPDGHGPVVVDNFVEVNGKNVCTGGLLSDGVESCFNAPVFHSIGAPALESYQSVLPLDISHRLRRGRARVRFSLVDYGGIYANSDVWLVTSCTAHRKVDICHKPGTRAEKVITVSQSAVSGHLGHGDTLDVTACRHSRRQGR